MDFSLSPSDFVWVSVYIVAFLKDRLVNLLGIDDQYRWIDLEEVKEINCTGRVEAEREKREIIPLT